MKGRHVRTCSLLFLFACNLLVFGQSSDVSVTPATQTNQTVQSNPPTPPKKNPDELIQALDVDAGALSKIPADPFIQADPLAPIFQPINKLADKSAQSLRLKFGATYTFLNQYATITPDSVRHNQFSGRLDFARNF
jgi:porin